MAQVTTLHPNGVSGQLWSFVAKDPPLVVEATTGKLDYTMSATLDYRLRPQWNLDESLPPDDLTGTVR